MTYVIAEPCVDVKDRACVIECPVDCIYEGERTLYINPWECVDCHACEPVCPVEAVIHEDDLPAQWAQYRSVNAEYFRDAPGESTGRAARADHAVVAALPPQHGVKSDLSGFAARKEETVDADLWFPW
ncbi:ferredoxin [Streptomyces sp. NRRL F-5122]|uniref:ferredoxin n=1 Tax=Streptomyces sp. NRRL F-5122 TaxID=1609098 RepID=UPI0007C72F40